MSRLAFSILILHKRKLIVNIEEMIKKIAYVEHMQ